MTTLEQLRQLLALADKATPGPWTIEGEGGYVDINCVDRDTAGVKYDRTLASAILEDGQYITACSPETIREIVQELIVARAQLKEIRDMHELDCNHCGGVAAFSAHLFWDGDFARCISCGIAGQIHADEHNCYFSESDEEGDRCEEASCDSCKR